MLSLTNLLGSFKDVSVLLVNTPVSEPRKLIPIGVFPVIHPLISAPSDNMMFLFAASVPEDPQAMLLAATKSPDKKILIGVRIPPYLA